MATIALFSAYEQTHCALAVCDSEKVTAALRSEVFFNIHGSGVLTALFCRYMTIKLLPSRRVLCTPYNHAAPVFHYVSPDSKPHT